MIMMDLVGLITIIVEVGHPWLDTVGPSRLVGRLGKRLEFEGGF